MKNSKFENHLLLKNGKSINKRFIEDKYLPYIVFGSNGVIGYTNTYNVEENSIIIGRVGANCGSIQFSKDKSWATDNTIVATVKSNNDPKYWFYLLSSLNLRNFAIGSAQPMLKQSIINSLEFKIHDYYSQKVIGNLLSTLDAKINLNNQINEKLEETAKAIYNEWFVNFNFPDENGLPYKDNGGEFYETELGEIPVGWTVTPLNQVFDFLEGPGIRKWQYTEKGVKFLNIRLIKNNDLDLESANMVSEDEAYGRYKHFLLEENDIIVSTSGTLGKYAVIRKEHLPLMLNTSIIRFRPLEKEFFNFMYQYLKSNSFYEELITRSSGSVQLNFGPTHLKEINIIKPQKSIIENFNNIISDFISKILKLKSENDTLNRILDLLINKLMSGQIDVNDLNIDWDKLSDTLEEVEAI